MSLAMSVALYFIIWWVSLFAVLPFGVHTQGDAGEIVQGTPASAPVAPRAGRIIAVTTALATVVFTLVWLAIRFRLTSSTFQPLAVQHSTAQCALQQSRLHRTMSFQVQSPYFRLRVHCLLRLTEPLKARPLAH